MNLNISLFFPFNNAKPSDLDVSWFVLTFVLVNLKHNQLISVFPAVNTAQKIKFSINGFFSKCDQINSFLRIWSNLLKNSLMENFIFCEVIT